MRTSLQPGRRRQARGAALALAACLLAGCVTNPITPRNYQAGSPPPVLGPILTAILPGVPQLIYGEFGEAAIYGALFLGSVTASIAGASGSVLSTAGAAVGMVTVAASIADVIVTTGTRYRQYTAIQAALGRVGEFVSSPGVKTERLFSAQYRQYQKEPVATVTVDNLSDYPLTDLVVSLAVPNLLEVDAQARVEGAVEPRGRRAVSLSVSLSPSLLDLTETTQFEGTVTVSYRAASVPASVTRPVVFEVLHKNAMTWDDDRKLGTFVTPNDAAVRIFGRSVAVFAAKRADGSLPLRLQTAAALFAALGEYGIVYVIDPATPFIEYRESKVAVDYVEYPVETLRSRTGDCDDLVSLYTALLESVGIPAMLVTGPGHIFLAFDSGVPLSELGRVWRLPESVFEYGGSLWVPVEATLVGASFVESWRSAADQYRAWTEQGGIARYPVRDAWKLYPPAAVPDKGWDPVPPAGEALGKRLDKELVELRSMVK